MKIIRGLRRGSLCSRTTLTISLVSSVFFLFTITVLGFFIVIPLAERTAGELASLVLMSTEALKRVAPERREAFRMHLLETYGLDVGPPPAGFRADEPRAPFFTLLERALEERQGRAIAILQSDRPAQDGKYWVRLEHRGAEIHVGFEYGHRWVDPPVLLLLIMAVGLSATFITGNTMARRLTRPLNEIADSARRLGRGASIEPLPESGPLEMRELVASFNRMSQQIHDLLANRTTLLAGISHDLRTPLTRMKLSVEMLESDDSVLVSQLRRDIAQMNRLIGLFLEVSRGLQEGRRELVDISALVGEIVEDFRNSGATILYRPDSPKWVRVHPLALRRIIINLVENAIRYGGGEELEVSQGPDGTAHGTIIEIRDRGPGIPEDKLQAVFEPFYRLEHSRSSKTGGSGLGLSIVRQLARANGWHVELAARRGGGTVATLHLPGGAGYGESLETA